jgi:hypothetical protein
MPKSSKKITVPLDVKWHPAWISWVGATTSCLNALGVKCDTTDVAGYSGYAFVMTIHEKLCPSGPTVFEWGTLLSGINYLGRSSFAFQSSECFTGEFKCDRTKEHCKQAFELAKSEIKAGRPCVLWGAYIPEFAVAYGMEGDKFLVKSYRECSKEEQPPVGYDEMNAPGGPYLLAFPSATSGDVSPRWDKCIIADGINKLTTDLPYDKYSSGLKAYDTWIKALETNTADGFGNGYNSQCYAELKRNLRDFMKRLADRNPKVKAPLDEAVKHYDDVVSAMEKVAQIFPFGAPDKVQDENNRKSAIEQLKKAKTAETLAVEAMRKAVAMDWV